MCCCPLRSSSARSLANGSAIRSPPRRRRGCGWAVLCRWATTRASERSSSTRPKPRPCVASLPYIVSSAACVGSSRRPTAWGSARSAARRRADSPIELTTPVAFRRRGVEMRLVLPAMASQNDRSKCGPTLIKAIARGRAWFEELAAGRARSLRELAERDGITRRYVRRLVDLAFLSPELVEAILHGRQPVELTATRLTELDLPLDWTDQRSLLAN